MSIYNEVSIVDIDKYGEKVSRTLQKGNSGLSVALWQQFLIQHKFMSSLSKDDMKDDSSRNKDDHIIGEFESSTEEATKEYQKQKGLKINGVLDATTYDMAAQEGFKGNETEAALLLGFNRVNRTLLFEFEIVFSPGKIIFKIGNKELTVNEALRHFKILDGLG
jgi:Putative peptidoglycan binding domain